MTFLAIIICIILVFIDQITKYFALVKLKPIGSIHVIKDVFNLTYVENRGAAFGLMQGAKWFFVIFTIIVVVGICYYYTKLPKGNVYNFIKVSLVLIVAGAIGNFIDRLFRGYVVDFLHATFIKFMNFPVFNVADIYVVVGSVLLAIIMIFFIKEEEEVSVENI